MLDVALSYAHNLMSFLCHSTGKSFLLNHIIAKLRLIYGNDFANCVAVTAATGIAATHICGVVFNAAPGPGAGK